MIETKMEISTVIALIDEAEAGGLWLVNLVDGQWYSPRRARSALDANPQAFDANAIILKSPQQHLQELNRALILACEESLEFLNEYARAQS